MHIKDMFEQLINELGVTLGIENLSQDEFGIIMLEVDKSLPLYLTFSEERESVLLSAELATVPADSPASVFRTLLAAQLFEQGTGGGHFALDDENGIITFHLEFKLNDSSTSLFNDVLENFINLCSDWQKTINNMIAEDFLTKEKEDDNNNTALLRV